MQPTCPICYNREFEDFNKRKNVRCSNCRSLERTRLMYLLIQRMGLLTTNSRILHFAPEPGLFRNLSRISKNYMAADYNSEAHHKWKPEVKFIDLCKIDEKFDGPFDLIIHNHVLEHLRCKPSKVVADLISRLSDDGSVIFSIPIRPDAMTDEDLGDLSSEERTRRFGQYDHIRFFGELDVVDQLVGPEGNNVAPIDTHEFLADFELKQNSINVDLDRLTHHNLFRARK